MHQNLSAQSASSMVPCCVLVIGAGIVGQDISDGILPLILSRPIMRFQYLISKWLAVAALATVAGLFDTFLHLLISYGFSSLIFQNFELIWIAQMFIVAAGCAAVMLLLSCLLPGAADVGIILLLGALWFLLITMQHVLHIPGMEEVGQQILAVIFPSFDVADITSFRSLLSIDVGRYFAVVCLSLWASVLVMNQKELSYGSH